MQEECIRILRSGGSAEITEKKSRFIADTAPVTTEAEAAAFLETVRKKYWDAGHHCSAFVLGPRNEITRCSDDGEPGGTAGRPILDVLTGSGVHDACIVVTRYFGGTLLGTGGLVRAYGQTAAEGLKNSRVLEKLAGRKLTFFCDYSEIGRIQYTAAERGLLAADSVYTDKVELSYYVKEGETASAEAAITEVSAGRVRILRSDPLYFALDGKDILTFEQA